MIRIFLLTTAAWLLASTGLAQITVSPPVADRDSPITAILSNAIPEGAQIQGGWSTPTVKTLPAPGVNSLHIWAKPGRHTIAFRGFWLKTRAITINGETVQVLEGFGFLDETTEFTVKGGDDDDDVVPPPPPPVTRLGVVVIEDAAARTSLPYGQVQAMTLADIREIPSVFRLVDRDNPAAGLAPWIALAKTIPWLILHDVVSGQVVWQGEVPKTAAEMRALLIKHKPRDAVQKALEQKADPQATVTPAKPQAAPARPQTVFGRIRR